MFISAIIITFNPDINQLNQLIGILKDCVQRIVVVDNASNYLPVEELVSCKGCDYVEFVILDDNIGIAAAQNIGIKASVAAGADHVMLFDQDSKPYSDMVSVLKESLFDLTAKSIKVAAVGPRYHDERQNNPPPFIEVRGLRVIRKRCEPCSPVVSVSYVIASGSLIPVRTLNVVGLMREDLFIDYVDIEWGLRAGQMGYQSYGVCNAFMEHDLGDEPIKFLGKSIPLHSPLRHYYLFRNALSLYKNPQLPWLWKVGDSYRLLIKYIFYTLFAKPRSSHFAMMTKGIWDGLRGRMGKYSGK